MASSKALGASLAMGLMLASSVCAGCGSGSASRPESSSGGVGAAGIAGSVTSGAAGADVVGGTSMGGGSAGSGGVGGAPIDCTQSDPLKTNNERYDAYDCAIIEVASKYGLPDPMIVKAQILQESSFAIFAISGDSPCGIKSGWTDAESKSFGLMQTTPACGEAKGSLLPDGHPNLSQDMNSADWATSVFNPPINLDFGVQTDARSLKSLKNKYPGCTDAQYNMMAAGAFNSGTRAVLGCNSFNDRALTYVTYITQYYKNFAAESGWPDPY